MDFTTVIKTRRSVRAYSDKPILDNVLDDRVADEPQKLV
jgi:nitroreductase